MPLFIILMLTQFLTELLIEIILNNVMYNNFFEMDLIWRNWLLVIMYEGIFYVFIFCSLYYISFFFFNTRRYYGILYLFTALITNCIIRFMIFTDSFFSMKFIIHPTYGTTDRILLLAIPIFLGLLIWFEPLKNGCKK